MQKLGTLRRLPLREIWPHEAADFTPWLSQNINALGESLGIDLELIESEASVGDFSLDILARDLGTGEPVIVENQLTQTDHDHLGKLLTYAAGQDAQTIVWICDSIREEHRQALDWLNQITDPNVRFFGVVVEILQIDDSSPAYNFKAVVFPNEWQKTQKKSSKQTSTRGEAYRAYFQRLIDELRALNFTTARAGQPQNWYSFSSGISGINYGHSFSTGEQVRVEVYIDFGDADRNKQLFDALREKELEIQAELDQQLAWERLDDRRACRIAIYRNGSIASEDSETESIRQWAIENLLAFKKVFGPRISLLMKI